MGVSATEQQKVIHTKGINDATDRYTTDQLNDPNRIKISEEEAAKQKEAPVKNEVAKASSITPLKKKAPAQVQVQVPMKKQDVQHEDRPVYSNNPVSNSGTSPISSAPSAKNHETTVKSNDPYEVVNTVSKQTTPEPVEKKEGWSHAAKGTVIGGGSGAILGAMVSKKRGKGAIIGGVLGAGAGYIFGKQKDKREDTPKNATTQYREY